MSNYNIHAFYIPDKLESKLQFLFEYSTIFIEAPSGFGKTTAIREHLKKNVSPNAMVCWVTLFTESPYQCWHRICKQLGNLDQGTSQELLQLGFPDDTNQYEIAELWRNIDCERETFFIIDNYQYVQTYLPFVIKEALADVGTKGKLHRIFLTQLMDMEDESLITQYHILYVGADYFRFTIQDIQQYFACVGIALTKEQLNQVYCYTEGWIAAIYLQMINFIETKRFEMVQEIDRLMNKAFWSKLDEEAKECLLRVSVFESFDLHQVRFMMGKEDLSEEILRLLLKNAFIRFDTFAQQYVLHSILQNFLYQIFTLQPDKKKNEIIEQAGKWYQSQGKSVLAARCFYRIRKFEQLFALDFTDFDLEEGQNQQGHCDLVIDILEHCPEEILHLHPKTMITFAFELFAAGKIQYYQQLCETIGKDIEVHPLLSEKQKERLRGELFFLLSFSAYNDIEKMGEYHRAAYERIEGESEVITVSGPWTFGSPSILYMFYREKGKLEEESKAMDKALPYYWKLADGHGMGAEIVLKAEQFFYQGDMDKAEILCHRTIFVTENKQQESIQCCALFLLMRISFYRGDLESGSQYLEKMRYLLDHSFSRMYRYTIEACEGFFYAMLGDLDAIPGWLKRGELEEHCPHFVTMPFVYIVYGKILILQEEYKKLLGLSPGVFEIAGVFPYLLPQLYFYLYNAIAHEKLGNHKEALEMLHFSLSMAKADKIYLPFVEHENDLEDVLKKIPGDAVKQILSLSTAYQKERNRLKNKGKKTSSILSQREKEVAVLAAQGFTNKEIAQKLYVSTGTVKNFLQRVYEKTGLKSRRQLEDYLQK